MPLEAPTFVLTPPPPGERLAPQALFGRRASLEVDVGCGKGRFLIARARANPATDFLGIDRRLKRIQKVEAKLRRERLSNVRLILAEAWHVVERLLPPQSVSTFYAFFSDPWPKRRHHRRRLLSPAFLDSLSRALAPEGAVHVATDHLEYFEEIHRAFARDERFSEIAPYQTTEEERTEFELTFMKLGTPVGRCSFRKVERPAAATVAPPRPNP